MNDTPPTSEEMQKSLEHAYDYGFNVGYKCSILDRNRKFKSEAERTMWLLEEKKVLSSVTPPL